MDNQLKERLDKAILAIYDIRIECYNILKELKELRREDGKRD